MTTKTDNGEGFVQDLFEAHENMRAELKRRGLPWTFDNVLMIVHETTDALVAEGKIARSDQGKLYPTD